MTPRAPSLSAGPLAPAPAVAWSGRGAALGAVYAVPAAAVMPFDVRLGTGLAVGVLPAAIAGRPAGGRASVAVLVLGVCTALSLFAGGLLAREPVLAVVAIALLGVGTALLAARSRAGQVAMTLSLPLVAIGFSYRDIDAAAGAAAVIVAGSLYAFVVLAFWPARASPAMGAAAAGPAAAPPTLGYGIRLGAAGATAAAIGFALDLEHVGWACGAALLVMRPAPEMQRLRSVGRVVAVAAGALAAVAFVRVSPPDVAYSLAAVAAVAGAAATHPSRWYVTAAFTTFLVFLLLLYADPASAGSRFGERLGETVLGVAIAYVFGLALPTPARWPSRRQRGPAAR